MLVLYGCAALQQEESAAAWEYIEGEQREDVEIDLPEKAENPTAGNAVPKDEPTDNPAEEEPKEEEPTVEYNEANRLKIVSYNIRYTDDPDGNSVDERAPA